MPGPMARSASAPASVGAARAVALIVVGAGGSGREVSADASRVPSDGTVPKFTACARSAALSVASRVSSGDIDAAIGAGISWRATVFACPTSPVIA